MPSPHSPTPACGVWLSRAVVLLLLLLHAFPASAAETTAGTEPVRVAALVEWSQTLARRGFQDGVTLTGANDTQELWLPLPRRLALQDARLRLPWQARLPAYRIAVLTVELDGRPAGAWRLERGEDEGVIELDLDPSILRRDGVGVRLTLRGAVGEDRCFDERFARGFVRFSASGGMFARAMPPEDIVGAIEALPHDVSLVIPAPATDEELRTALAAAIRLDRAGHRVLFRERYASGAHIAIAAAAGRLRSAPDVEAALDNLDDGQMRLAAGTLVLAGEPAAALLETPDRVLAAMRGASDSHARGADAIWRFAALGVGNREFRVLDEGGTAVGFSLRDFPPGLWPEAVELSLMSPPQLADVPSVLHLHVNGVLLGTRRLAAEGGSERFLFRLPTETIGLSNTLRLTVQRQAPSEACRTQPSGAIFQLRADSAFRLTTAPEPLRDIAMVATRAGTAGLVFSADARDRPAAHLAAATFVLRDALRLELQADSHGGTMGGLSTARVHVGHIHDEPRRRFAPWLEQRLRLAASPEGGRRPVAGVMQILPDGTLEVLPVHEPFPAPDARFHREAFAVFDEKGFLARLDTADREERERADLWTRLPDESDQGREWVLRIGFAIAGLVFGTLAMLTARRRRF